MYFCKKYYLYVYKMKARYISFIIILLSLFFCNSATARVKQVTLHDSAFASLLTCGAGEDFYESFGHSALRICDTANKIDIVFNYGTFDFNEPNFYLKFAKGQLNYCVVALSFDEFMFEYMYYGRAVWEQRINLSKKELQRLYDALLVNIRPENMYYKYDFFRDNCATRVRDMIENSMINRSVADTSMPKDALSYRQLLHHNSEARNAWWLLGTDLLLGARCDKKMTTSDYAFHPIELMGQYDTLTAGGMPLAEEATQELKDRRENSGTAVSPTLCFWIFFALVAIISFMGYFSRWKLVWLDVIIFGVATLIGCFLLFMWLGTDHWCTKWNTDLLWANPLHLITLLTLRKQMRPFRWTMAALTLPLLVACIFVPHLVNPAVIPFILAMDVRLLCKE